MHTLNIRLYPSNLVRTEPLSSLIHGFQVCSDTQRCPSLIPSDQTPYRVIYHHDRCSSVRRKRLKGTFSKTLYWFICKPERGKWEIQTRFRREKSKDGDGEKMGRNSESRLLLKALLAVPGHWVCTISGLYRLLLHTRCFPPCITSQPNHLFWRLLLLAYTMLHLSNITGWKSVFCIWSINPQTLFLSQLIRVLWWRKELHVNPKS